MSLSTTVLVAIMYTTILSMGVGGVLAFLAGVVQRGGELRADGLLLSWVLLLLASQLNMFWSTVEITALDDWRFVGFLYIICGPVLILFATHVMTTLPDGETGLSSGVPARFFLIFALLQVWIGSTDVALGRGISLGTALVVCNALLMLALWSVRATAVQRLGAGAAWLLLIAVGVARGLEGIA